MSYLTPAQERLLIASGPDDITGEEGHGVELRGSDYRVARKLNELGLGIYTHGSPYGDLYFNNREGMELRADLTTPVTDGDSARVSDTSGDGV